MSVSIRIIGSNVDSEEYKAALRLKNKIDEEIPNSAFGEIIIHANATLFGQTIKDIDILLIGVLHNYRPKVNFLDCNNESTIEKVDVRSFCTAIEVKSHNIGGIYREGTELYVKYPDGFHSVTFQSEQQKISVMNYFKSSFNGFCPFVTNVIWFNEITQNELVEIMTVDQDMTPTNALSGECTFKNIIQAILWQKKPQLYNNEYHFDSNYQNYSAEDLKRSLELFARAKSTMGDLTRKRVEQICAKNITSTVKNENKYTILRGRAGSGKTVGLINCAIHIVEETDARVLLLTYNKALVSDIRRLFAFADLPDLFNESSVSISTIHSYLYRIVKNVLYGGNLDGLLFLEEYDRYISELYEFLISDEDTKALLMQMMKDDISLSWDYCFVDEAQDCTAMERDVLRQLFPLDHLMIADGGNQYVRSVATCDWGDISDRNNIKLKYCLRQKNNLVKFVNNYISEIGNSESTIMSKNQLLGGAIKIVKHSNPLDIIESEILHLKNTGNNLYDMILFVSSSMVEENGKLVERYEYERRGINIWEGTDKEIRNEYPILSDEVRVLQYESGRGLEAWTVVCLEFDEFLERKMSQYDENGKTDTLALESSEEKRIKYYLNWSLIPFTRAIDTLVISFKNPNSEIAKDLLKLSEKYPDYIETV